MMIKAFISQELTMKKLLYQKMGFSGGSDGKESACNAGDPGLIPGSGRSHGERLATHSSILAWRIPQTEVTVHGVTMSQTRLND